MNNFKTKKKFKNNLLKLLNLKELNKVLRKKNLYLIRINLLNYFNPLKNFNLKNNKTSHRMKIKAEISKI